MNEMVTQILKEPCFLLSFWKLFISSTSIFSNQWSFLWTVDETVKLLSVQLSYNLISFTYMFGEIHLQIGEEGLPIQQGSFFYKLNNVIFNNPLNQFIGDTVIGLILPNFFLKIWLLHWLATNLSLNV